MMTSDDAGNYHCHDCGHRWKRSTHYKVWPVRVHWDGWARSALKRWHIEVGARGIEQRVYATVVRVGPIRATFGYVPRKNAAPGVVP